ncbi:unnamed protein product [Effrenium voratum]|uniref:Peptidase S59 domain-containing protein n=1 Tax=Effrenium voratum TaxID=2562239 RepID=A0AA36IEU7_9DINO|nr:unnamed protein product [Effrenium voratum]
MGLDPAVFEPPEEDEETLHEEDEVPEEPFAPEERTPQQVPEERVPEEREETPEERHYQEHMRERAQERVTKTYSSMGSRNRSSQLASRARRLSLPEVQDESQRCREALIACAKEISTKEVREMRMLKKALPQVSRILDAVSLLLDGGSSKKLLADSLPARLESYNPGTMTLQQRNKVAALLTAETKPEAVAKLYKPAVSLARWCECITVFLARTEPLLDEDEPESGPDYPAAVKRVSSQMSSQPSYAQEREMPRRRETGLLVEPELSKLSPSQLQAVPNLTITKPGVGSVTFHGITDCTDLDVEKDVVLKRGYVLVYPDTKKKPAVGQGLNKHATVTMFQCFPPGEPVKTLSDDAVQEYKDKIRRMTEENSACKFIDYDCQTGVWKFEVPVLSFAPPNLLGALRDPEVSPQFGAWPVSPQPSPALSYRSLRPSPQSRLLSDSLRTLHLVLPAHLGQVTAVPVRTGLEPCPWCSQPTFAESSGSSSNATSGRGRALSPAPGARSPPLPSHRDLVPMPPPAEADSLRTLHLVLPAHLGQVTAVPVRTGLEPCPWCSQPTFAESSGSGSNATSGRGEPCRTDQSQLHKHQFKLDGEAKTSAAEQQAQSEQAILMRQGQLRQLGLRTRETFNVLRASGLTEALRRWPSPETPEQASPRKEPSLASVMEELPALSSLMEKTPQAERAEKEKPDGPAHERRKASSSRASRSRRLSASQSEARRCSKALAKVAAQMFLGSDAGSTRQLRELRRLRLPAPVLQLLELLAQLLGEDPKASPTGFRVVMESTPRSYVQTHFLSDSQTLIRQPSRQHGGPEFDLLCPACSALSKWCDCIMVFLSRTEDLDSTELEYPSAGEEEAETVEPDLSSLSSSELAAVRELTVTKPGVGSVVFHGVTDCTDLDLHRDVFLKRGYVIVYPDQKKKPPLGHGLNKPATVTMYQCFPPGEPVRSEQAMKEYKERIRRMTEENSSCKFIDYDCETGVWQFDVTRF